MFNVVQKLKWLIPLATLFLGAAAVEVAVRRRKTLLRITLSGSIAVVVFLVTLGLVRHGFVSAATKHGLNGQTTAIIFDTLLRYLKDGLWIALAVLFGALGGALDGGVRPPRRGHVPSPRRRSGRCQQCQAKLRLPWISTAPTRLQFRPLARPAHEAVTATSRVAYSHQIRRNLSKLLSDVTSDSWTLPRGPSHWDAGRHRATCKTHTL